MQGFGRTFATLRIAPESPCGTRLVFTRIGAVNALTGLLTGMALGLVATVPPVTGRDTALPHRPELELVRRVSTAAEINAQMRPFPAAAWASVDRLFSFVATPLQQPFNPTEATALVDFVTQACGADSGWKLPPLASAEGAAYVVTIAAPLQHYLDLNFNPGIPDFAVFPASLRYSACMDRKAMQQAYACIGMGPTGAQHNGVRAGHP